jgi:lipid-binding SYLF domain-containing protein
MSFLQKCPCGVHSFHLFCSTTRIRLDRSGEVWFEEGMMKFLAPASAALVLASTAFAEPAMVLKEKSERALRHLYNTNPGAQAIGEKSLAVLVFPEVFKAGFIFGASRGDGVLFKNGAVDGYFNTTAASYGLQAGIQKYGYALFFMDEKSLKYLRSSDGFELGAAPSLVVADKGFSSSISTTTVHQGIYAFFFSQAGLMAGISVQGTKITEFTPSE